MNKLLLNPEKEGIAQPKWSVAGGECSVVGCVKWSRLPSPIWMADRLCCHRIYLCIQSDHVTHRMRSWHPRVLNSVVASNTSTPHPQPLSPKRGEGSGDQMRQPSLTYLRKHKVLGMFGQRVSEATQSQPEASARDSTANPASNAKSHSTPFVPQGLATLRPRYSRQWQRLLATLSLANASGCDGRTLRVPILFQFLFLLLTLLLSSSHLLAQSTPSATRPASVMTLKLRPNVVCSNNLLLMQDIAEVRGDPSRVAELEKIPIAPSPLYGRTHTWTRDEINRVLVVRGFDLQGIRWEGSGEARVERATQTQASQAKPPQSDSPQIAPVVTSPNKTIQAKMVSHPSPLSPPGPPPQRGSGVSPDIAPATSSETPESRFTAAFVSPALISQAENVARSAIGSYLQTKTDSTAEFRIQPVVPPEHAKILAMRRQIVGIAGGTPPYEGEQQFELLVKTAIGEEKIPIRATVQLPDLVLVAAKPLRKGQLVRSDDLVYLPLPKSANVDSDQCFIRMEELVGQELKRAMSTHQVIRRNEVGTPVLVRAGDLIKIEVVRGGVVIETNGKAIESGGLDDLIQVETADYRKRLVARVRSDRLVEVYSQGNGTATTR